MSLCRFEWAGRGPLETSLFAANRQRMRTSLTHTEAVGSDPFRPLATATEAEPTLALRELDLPEAPPLARAGSWAGPSSFLLSLFISSILFSLGDPPGPGPGSLLFTPHVNQPVNGRIFVPPPRLLVPYSWKIGSIQRFPPPWSGLLRASTGPFCSSLRTAPVEVRAEATSVRTSEPDRQKRTMCNDVFSRVSEGRIPSF